MLTFFQEVCVMVEKEKILQALGGIAEKGEVSCPRALALAQQLGINPLIIGDACNELGLTISGCQLGCFGKGDKN
jgi:hypothetical protein